MPGGRASPQSPHVFRGGFKLPKHMKSPLHAPCEGGNQSPEGIGHNSSLLHKSQTMTGLCPGIRDGECTAARNYTRFNTKNNFERARGLLKKHGKRTVSTTQSWTFLLLPSVGDSLGIMSPPHCREIWMGKSFPGQERGLVGIPLYIGCIRINLLVRQVIVPLASRQIG